MYTIWQHCCDAPDAAFLLQKIEEAPEHSGQDDQVAVTYARANFLKYNYYIYMYNIYLYKINTPGPILLISLGHGLQPKTKPE
jgi:hypothetical protein